MYHPPGRSNDPNKVYDVRLVRYGPAPAFPAPFTPGSLTIQVTATSSFNARNAAQASYAGYSVVDVTERRT